MIDASEVRVLVIEDDPGMRRFLRNTLQLQHYDVKETAFADEALGMLRQARPELVILDLGLPDRDGMELIGLIRQSSAVPIEMSWPSTTAAWPGWTSAALQPVASALTASAATAYVRRDLTSWAPWSRSGRARSRSLRGPIQAGPRHGAPAPPSRAAARARSSSAP